MPCDRACASVGDRTEIRNGASVARGRYCGDPAQVNPGAFVGGDQCSGCAGGAVDDGARVDHDPGAEEAFGADDRAGGLDSTEIDEGPRFVRDFDADPTGGDQPRRRVALPVGDQPATVEDYSVRIQCNGP